MSHARLGFSDAKLWLACGVYCHTIEGITDVEETPATVFGDTSHEILERSLIDAEVPSGSEEADCAAVAYEYVHKRWTDMGYESAKCLTEYNAAIKSTGRNDLSGTGDVFLYDDKVLEYIDLKSGAGTFVDEVNDPQLKLNALALIENKGLTPEVVRLTIVQPRYWDSTVESIRTYETTVTALKFWLATVATPAINANDDPESVGTVGVHCKKCKGRSICTYRDQAVAGALTGQLLDSTHDVLEESMRKHQDFCVYDNELLAETLDMIPVIKDFCDALEEHAKEIIMRGEQVNGYKVVSSSGRQYWADEEGAREALNKSKVKKEEYTKQVLKTPNQVLALSKVSVGLKSKLEAAIGRKNGGLSLVIDSDPRDSAAPQFKVLTQEPAPELPLPTTEVDSFFLT